MNKDEKKYSISNEIINDEMIKIQSEINNIFIDSFKNEGMELDDKSKEMLSPLDSNLLLSKCAEFYEINDTKEDIKRKLLVYIKENKEQFKYFSTIADEKLKADEELKKVEKTSLIGKLLQKTFIGKSIQHHKDIIEIVNKSRKI